MSESTLPIGNILNSLMEHPEMLQKAMNLAGTLASSGILDNLINTPTDGAESAPSPDRFAPPTNASPDLSSIGNLLSGLMGSVGGHEAKDNGAKSGEQKQNIGFDRSNEGGSRPSEDFSSDKQQARLPDRSSHHNSPHIGHTERIRLLQSLRPFLPYDKQEKIDFVIKLLGLLEAAEHMGLGKLF